MNEKYVGSRQPIHDAKSKVTGRCEYTVDMRRQGMLFAAMLHSPVGHAYIKSIDTTEALALPGVHYVATCFNTPDTLYNSALRFIGHKMKPDEQVFPRKLRYVGDRVAAVAAESQALAEQAVKLIRVEYEPLPVVIDVEEALLEDAPAIHEGGNLLGQMEVSAGDVDAALQKADHCFEGRFYTPIVHHYAMEPHAVVAEYDGENLTLWTSAQNIFAFRILVAQIYGLPVNRVRLIRPPVGGGFGGKYEMVLEPVAAWLAMQTRRVVMLELSRKDCMVSTRTRHAAVTYLKMGVNKDGLIQAISYKELVNAGAYAGSSMNVLGGASAKSMMLYRAPNMRFTGIGVYTNSPVAGAMRGYGSPQIETPLELMMDRIAKELGIPADELRQKNLVQPGDINPAKKTSLGNCRARDCLAKGKELIGWNEEVQQLEGGRIRKAMGLSCGVHGNGVSGVMIDYSGAILKMAEDGSLILFTGAQDIGQGTVVMLKALVAETLQIPPESIAVVEADTTTTPFDMGTFSSRGTFVSGEATRKAAEELKALLLAEAAQMLETDPEDLAVENGAVVCKSQPEKRADYGVLALYAQQVSWHGELVANHYHYSRHNPGSYAADFAEVEVDMETGQVRVTRFVAVHDVGRAINPMMVEGQVEGGIQMGLGYGLTEELKQDRETGAVTNALTKKYGLFKAKDMPKITVALVEEGEEHGPFGGKSIGEIATVPVAAAVVNAVNRAIGGAICELPATPEKVLAEIARLKRQGSL